MVKKIIGFKKKFERGMVALARHLSYLKRHVTELRWLYNKKFTRKMTRKLLSTQKLSEPILDLGCAWGRITSALSLNDYEVIGVDIVKYPQWRKINAQFLISDGHFLPFQQKVFKTAILILTLGYCRNDVKVLQEVHRALSNDAEVIVHVARKQYWKKNSKDTLDPKQIRNYTKKQLIHILNQTSFQVTNIETSKFYIPRPFHSLLFSFFPDNITEIMGKILPEKCRGIIMISATID